MKNKGLIIVWFSLLIMILGVGMSNLYGETIYKIVHGLTYDTYVPAGTYGLEVFIIPTFMWLVMGLLIFSEDIYNWGFKKWGFTQNMQR